MYMYTFIYIHTYGAPASMENPVGHISKPKLCTKSRDFPMRLSCRPCWIPVGSLLWALFFVHGIMDIQGSI